MIKQKITGIALAAVLLGTAFAFTEQTNASAQSAAAELTTANAQLILPDSYEQYLPLSNPSHIAMSEEHIAVADGSTLYLYDRAEGTYTLYAHTTGQDDTPTTISELQFTEDGQLYFTDQSTGLYLFGDGSAIPQNLSCSTFLIEGETLYYATSVTTGTVSFYYVPLAAIGNAEKARVLLDQFTGSEPHFAYENGTLHCMINNNFRYSYDTTTHKQVNGAGSFLNNSVTQIAGLRYVCALGKELYYSSADGLYRTDEDGNAELILAGSGFSTLTAYQNTLYCVKGSSIVGIDVTGGTASYTGYEIAAASSSVNRLSGAVDVVRAGELVVTADAGNRRVCVYRIDTDTYSEYPCTFTPSLVATDGETIVAADGSAIYKLSYSETEFVEIESAVNVAGLACVYGNIYYVTSNGILGQVGGSPAFRSYGIAGLAQDLYGTLYIAYENGSVYSFTESEFAAAGGGTQLGFTLPQNYSSFRADFEGNLYCLEGNTLYKNGETFAQIDGGDFVWQQDESDAPPVSFALGFEDSEVYFCFGNYVVRSDADALEIPTLNAISAGDIPATLGVTHASDRLLVSIPSGTVGILTDLAELKDSSCFPYRRYYRTEEVKEGVLIGETESYYLVVLFEDNAYTANVFRKNENYLLPEESYWTETERSAYLSSTVSPYHFPCLASELGEDKLARGIAVTVQGIVAAPERDYALIEYTADGATKSGYVPLSYITDISPIAADEESYTLGWIKANDDGILFTADNGETLLVTERTEAKFYQDGDGYTARFEKDGTVYTAHVTAEEMDIGESDALRISLIIILTVLALVIVGSYIYLLPKKGKK